MRVRTETIMIYDSFLDKEVPHKVAKLKNPLMTTLPMAIEQNVLVVPQDLDPDDIVMTPILQILRDREHEVDPEVTCIRGDRAGCTSYEQLVRLSNLYLRQNSKKMRNAHVNMPEVVFLLGQPRFCQHCMMAEQRKRKQDNRRWRRFIRWIRPNQ